MQDLFTFTTSQSKTMSQYHPDASPDFIAMHSHYERLWSGDFSQALFNAFQAVDFIVLDSEMRDFSCKLWQQGYKIVPVFDLSANVAGNSYSVPEPTDRTTGTND